MCVCVYTTVERILQLSRAREFLTILNNVLINNNTRTVMTLYASIN